VRARPRPLHPSRIERRKSRRLYGHLAFRYQIYASRAFVAVVEGVQKRPNLLAIFDRGYGEMKQASISNYTKMTGRNPTGKPFHV